MFRLDGGESHALSGLEPGDTPLGWSTDQRVFVLRSNGPSATIFAVNPTTGASTQIQSFTPSDRTGVDQMQSVLVTPDGKTSVFYYRHWLTRLLLVEGLR